MTTLWFDSVDSVRSFAGANDEIPVIIEKAHALLARYAECCEHDKVSELQFSQ